MHNLIDLEVNKINSNLYEDFLPEEKDYYINKSINSFINTRFDSKSNSKQSGFEMTEKRINDFRSLVEFNKPISFYQLSDGFLFANLPNDFLKYSTSIINIKGNFCKDITVSATTSYVTYTTIPFKFDITSFENFDIKSNGTSILNRDLFDLYSFPEYSYDFGRELQNRILPSFSTDYKLYWEVCKNIYLPNTLIIEKLNSSASSLTYISNISSTSLDWKIEDSISLDSTGTSSTINTDFISFNELNTNNPYKKSDITSVKYSVAENKIITKYNLKYLPLSMNLTYIRKPLKVNYYLDVGCELSDSVHQEIVNMTVNSILEAIESRRFNTNAVELNKQE